MNITIESDRPAGAIQTIVAEVLHEQVGVTQAGRLVNEVTLPARRYSAAAIQRLRVALSANGHKCYVTMGAGQ